MNSICRGGILKREAVGRSIICNHHHRVVVGRVVQPAVERIGIVGF